MHEPFFTREPETPSRWMITVDHARNTVPEWVNGGDLGLPVEDMHRHIAYDVGAEGVSRRLAELLNARLIGTNFSRLVIDPNRGEDDPTLVMEIYDGSVIPANRGISEEQTRERLDQLYRPYHRAYNEMLSGHDETILIALHTFTPQFKHRAPRPWEVGILYVHEDDRLARPFIDRLRAETPWCVGENQPYAGHLPGDSIDRHALSANIPNILIEIRNDLIETPEQQVQWAEALYPHIAALPDLAGL